VDLDPRRRLYQAVDGVLVRTAAQADITVPGWPDLGDTTPEGVEQWRSWLRAVWSLPAVVEAVEHASPSLARDLEEARAGRLADPRATRRAALALVRYLLRMTGRATPFGLFAGVAPASVGDELVMRWGDQHRAVARPDAAWLADVTGRLEACPPLRERLPVVVNNLAFSRGNRLVVPFPTRPAGASRATPVEVSVRRTRAVAAAIGAAREPISRESLVGKLLAEFPSAAPSSIEALVDDLAMNGVLLSALRPPSTAPDPLGFVLEQLDGVSAADVPEAADLLLGLREVRRNLGRHSGEFDEAADGQSDDYKPRVRAARTAVTRRMATLSTAGRQPLAVDLLLDCSLVLPSTVLRAAETATTVLARLTPHPLGAPAWHAYHGRFFERYGIGALVPVLDLVDPDVGLGFPAGYAASTSAEPSRALTARDDRLLALAQAAAFERRDEIVLDDRLVAELAADDLQQARVPPHLELCCQLHASSAAELERGDFSLAVLSISRGVGTMTGRFLDLLPAADRHRMAMAFARLAENDPDALVAQISFAPLDPVAGNVTRAPTMLPALISLGEHRATDGTVLPLADLAVTSDGERLCLASLSQRRRVEPTALHALEPRFHTPQLARFLGEVARAQSTVVSGFDWGAAFRLPYLPRVRYRQTILASARWMLDANDLPDRKAPWQAWRRALDGWRDRRGLPTVANLADGDRHLRLNLAEPAHLAVLRAHLERSGRARLTEAPGTEAFGWFDGRPHEIVVPLLATPPSRRPPPPTLIAAPVVRRDDDHLPGASRWLYAKLYGHPDRQPEILAQHLPRLVNTWDEPPVWWFIRYRDPEWHLRLRLALPDPAQFGTAATRVANWADQLRRQGLLADLAFATYRPETGRWGSGPTMSAAETVFAADSRALLSQFAEPSRPEAGVCAASQFVAIAISFTGSTAAGMRWLIDHAPRATFAPRPRGLLADAVRLADPCGDWAALRAAPGGDQIVSAWKDRDEALAAYRASLMTDIAIGPDAVLIALLHAHHIRAVGIDRDDEARCLGLARAAALAWTARAGGDTR